MTGLRLDIAGDRQAIVTRPFVAAPDLVFRAHTEPALLQRWCLGPDGWQMPECRFDPWPGGSFLFRWANAEGQGFHATGEILEIEEGRRILHVERMFLPEATPDNRVETLFLPEGPGTVMKMTMALPDAVSLKSMLDTGMAEGLEISYQRLETILQPR